MAQTVKILSAMQETQVWYLGQEDILEKERQHTPVSLPGKSHGQRSLAGYSRKGRHDWVTNTYLLSYLPNVSKINTNLSYTSNT